MNVRLFFSSVSRRAKFPVPPMHRAELLDDNGRRLYRSRLYPTKLQVLMAVRDKSLEEGWRVLLGDSNVVLTIK